MATRQRGTGPGTEPRGSGDRVQLGRFPGWSGGSVGYGPQPVVELPAAAVVQGDGCVEAHPAVELHVRPEPVDAWGE